MIADHDMLEVQTGTVDAVEFEPTRAADRVTVSGQVTGEVVQDRYGEEYDRYTLAVRFWDDPNHPEWGVTVDGEKVTSVKELVTRLADGLLGWSVRWWDYGGLVNVVRVEFTRVPDPA